MPISAKELEEKLKNEIQATHLFEGKPLIQRHRLVHSTLEEELKDIHAFSMKTLTPEQWQKQNS
ncbi:BOLA2-like protein [Mya arenaria]|uniref:BOLA2-like protein n=1 Tax=Mya arenaria TaxID=6604 RepID=A0ABY7E0U8_MYAAR|nr:BOLA2-like protein [Mya arenaria]